MTVGVDQGVPSLARVAGSPQHGLPVVDDPRAYPGLSRDVDEMGHPDPDSAPIFGESAEIGFVGHEDRMAQPEDGSEHLTEGNVPPAEVGGELDETVGSPGDPGDAHSDPGEARVGGQAR